MFETPDIPGAADVVAWFGYWPTFHDAEVLWIKLDRSGNSEVAIHAFEMTAEVDADNSFVLRKHAVLTFRLEGFPVDQSSDTAVRIEAFNHQNVLCGAVVNQHPQGYELVLEGTYGVDGSIVCERMTVALTPGIPPGSMYEESGK